MGRSKTRSLAVSSTLTWGTIGLLAASTLARYHLARRAQRADANTTASKLTNAPGTALAQTTVLIPIRSGDPLLPNLLAESVATLAPAAVALLVDDDDPEAQEIAERVAVRDGVEVVRFPPPPPGVNPKVHKLTLATPDDGVVAVLDDDAVFPAGGLANLVKELDRFDLVTAVPVYREQGSLWSRLLAAFVNGSSLMSYLPMALVGPPVSINGMAYATRRSTLEAIGGFAAIETATCDDYALARRYRARGLTIKQSSQPVIVTTTVLGPREYARIMRRWMLFAMQVPLRDPSLRLATLVVLPAAMPTIALAMVARARSPRALCTAVATIAVGAVLNRRLRHDTKQTGGLGALLEPFAHLVTPFHAAAALLGPRTVTWRGRKVRVGLGDVP